MAHWPLLTTRPISILGEARWLQDVQVSRDRPELAHLWQDTLLNQFHDVLPGSGISKVVDDALEIYQRREPQARMLIQAALKSLCSGHDEQFPYGGSRDGACVIDPLRMARREVVETPGHQHVFIQTDVYGFGSVVTPPSLDSPRAQHKTTHYTLENRDVRLTLSEGGRITSLVDLSCNKELIAPGQEVETGGLVLYEDYPLRFDAWDVEVYHLKSAVPITFQAVQVIQGPLRSCLKATARFGKSQAVVTVSRVPREHSRTLLTRVIVFARRDGT